MNDMNPAIRDELDMALREQFQLHIVGVYTAFSPLRESGVRLLMTAKGLMLEACNGVYYHRDYLVKELPSITLPYGELEPIIELVNPVDQELVSMFISQARRDAHEKSDTEIVRLIIKAPGRAPRCINPTLKSSSTHAEYDLSQIAADEEIIVDLHSHGVGKPFFSSTDNLDDSRYKGHLKLSIVLGLCDLEPAQMSCATRFVSRGMTFQALWGEQSC